MSVKIYFQWKYENNVWNSFSWIFANFVPTFKVKHRVRIQHFIVMLPREAILLKQLKRNANTVGTIIRTNQINRYFILLPVLRPVRVAWPRNYYTHIGWSVVYTHWYGKANAPVTVGLLSTILHCYLWKRYSYNNIL